MIQRRRSTEGRKDTTRTKTVDIVPSRQLTTMEFNSPKYLQSPPPFLPSKRESPLKQQQQHQHQQQVDDPGFYGRSRGENPFVELVDPLCKLNLRETSEFVRAFPVAAMASRSCNESRGMGLFDSSAQRRRTAAAAAAAAATGEGQPQPQQRRTTVESPSTPGRPMFGFSGNAGRKSLPSKWEDAEKWLVSASCHESPAQLMKPSRLSTQAAAAAAAEVVCHRGDGFADGRFVRVSEDKGQGTVVLSFHGCSSLEPAAEDSHGFSPSNIVLKDKFTDSVQPIFPSSFQYAEPTKETFLFNNSSSSVCDSKTTAATTTEPISDLHHRDVGTETTPSGSLSTSRCHTPLKGALTSPERHNTPADRSGLLVPPPKASVDILDLKDYHFEKLELGGGGQFDSIVSNWSSREEEEEEVSKSLRHFDDGCGGGARRSVAEARAAAWEDEERTKSCIRYQREEARIQAWVNHQSAKAEAQARKLEVKIQKMRSNLEEKLMKRMAAVHKKAEEWRAAAQAQHSQQVHRAAEQANKMRTQQQQEASSYLYPHHHHNHLYTRCGCFPCTNNNRI